MSKIINISPRVPCDFPRLSFSDISSNIAARFSSNCVIEYNFHFRVASEFSACEM